jgi:hypothetical protein
MTRPKTKSRPPLRAGIREKCDEEVERCGLYPGCGSQRRDLRTLIGRTCSDMTQRIVMTDESRQSPAPEPPPTLEYAKRQKRAWIGRLKRLLIVTALVSAFAIPIYLHRDGIWIWVQWQYWIRQAASFEMPKSSTPLIETDPVRIGQLTSSNSDYVLTADPIFHTRQTVYIPSAFREWTKYDSRTHWGGYIGEEPVAFLGTMRRPDGARRLVVIRGDYVNAHDLHDLSVLVLPVPEVFQAVPKRTGRIPLSVYSGQWIGGLIFSGVLDPNDSARLVFPIDVFVDHKPLATEVRGHLGNDDCITFELKATPELLARHIPTTQRTISGTIP